MKLVDFPHIRRDVPMSGYTTFGVGGPADYFFELKDVRVLPELLAAAHESDVPFFVLGGGSNVLFPDEGYRGLVVRIAANEVRVEGDRLIAEAGAKWPKVLEAMKAARLTGMEAFAGLPGTMGGAVRGNAGCFGTEIKDVFELAKLLNPKTGEIREVGPEDLQFKYRWSRLKDISQNGIPDMVLEVTFRLRRLSPNEVAPDIPTSALRLQKQPPGKSSGSFFKNPSSDRPAGQLIDQCGLKGLTIGGAQISEKHGNFFMNVNGATAADVLTLRDRAKEAVRQKFGIELEEEVVIVKNP